ncbi:hypothetical protein PTSG_00615 [Salpingoeca rosetta]|uniref:Uncharacterized protein n=1 Tax=Salpingoeca rosetta (strain ATCC 50818 / BSB-021) TaxID=946362 RepID=F2TWZ7_SALR5|nr:uncharacterized protein PTSG_00615 [Salpingoeca rosetta]EGD75906.1 hypothetical protein PTSG_00615 [Salpingoeca rosetta]|eukprot:XP_004998082.1 hypothetical protein PTSG_00615 [Salpingoeca rosetta]
MFDRVRKWFDGVYKSFTDPNDTTPSSSSAPGAGSRPGATKPTNVVVPVTAKQGSRFVDEDGFAAHEFYEEAEDGHTLKRVPQSRLRPEGTIKLDKPVLPTDCPILLCTAHSF